MSPIGCGHAFLIVFIWTALFGVVVLVPWGMAFPLFIARVLATWSILRRRRAVSREGPVDRLPDIVYP